MNVLLRLDDAWEDLSLKILPRLHDETSPKRDQWNRAVYRYALTMRAIIGDGLQTLLDYGGDRSRYLPELPEFQIMMSNTESESLVQEGFRQLAIIPGHVYWMTYPVSLAGKEHAEVLLVMQPPGAELKFFAIDLVWEWLRILHSKRTAMMALRFKTGLLTREDREFDFGLLEDSSKLPDMNESLAQSGFSTRSIRGGAQSLDAWNSDLREKIQEGFPTLELGINSKENILAVDRQVDATAEAYRKLPGFRGTFRTHYGHSFAQFIRITKKLLGLARIPGAAVYCEPTESLVSQVQAVENSKNVARIIGSMTCKPRSTIEEFPIINTNGYSMFQFGRVLSAISERPRIVYGRYYNNNPKGEMFERRCREILLANGFDCLPGRVDIPKGFSPTKDSTDIDVIGRKENLILVLECKQEKFRLTSRLSGKPTKTQNQFLHYARETEQRAAWLSVRENTDVLKNRKLRRIVSPRSELFLIPLVVTTYPITPALGPRSVAVMTINELERLAMRLDSSYLTESSEGIGLDLAEFTSGEEKVSVAFPLLQS